MSKKLEEALGLPSMSDLEEIDSIAESLENASDSPIVKTKEDISVDEHVEEMDEIYNSAVKAHNEILDLGYSVETKYTAGILNSSATFLDIALKASKSKIDNRLKALKQKEDAKIADSTRKSLQGESIDVDVDSSSGTVEVLTRNEMMARINNILEQSKGSKTK